MNERLRSILDHCADLLSEARHEAFDDDAAGLRGEPAGQVGPAVPTLGHARDIEAGSRDTSRRSRATRPGSTSSTSAPRVQAAAAHDPRPRWPLPA